MADGHSRDSPVAFVSVLHPLASYGIDASNPTVRILDLTDDAERYFSDSPQDTFARLETWLKTTGTSRPFLRWLG